MSRFELVNAMPPKPDASANPNEVSPPSAYESGERSLDPAVATFLASRKKKR